MAAADLFDAGDGACYRGRFARVLAVVAADPGVRLRRGRGAGCG